MTKEWSRRKFMASLGLAGIGVAVVPTIGWSNGIKNEKATAIVAKAMGIDAHNHIDVPFNKNSFSNIKNDLATQMKQSGLSAIGMTFCVDRPNLATKGEAYERFIIALDEMDLLLANNGMQRALSYKDWENAKANNIPIVIQAVEGGHFIEDNLERLDVAYNRGVRHLGLLHDNQSAYPLGDIYTNEEKFGGLTSLGKEVVKKCNSLGMLVDLAHCSNKAINSALEVATKPLIISHTGLNTQLGNDERMAKMMMPRLISKEQAKVVANAGGVVGVWTHLADTTYAMATNIAALVDVMGADHVAIGTDTKMINPTKGNNRFGHATNTAFSTIENGFLYDLVASMLKVGFNEDEIIKIVGGNYARIFKAAT